MQSIFVKLNKADLLGNTRTMNHNSWINFINEGYNSKNFSEFLKEKKIEILKFFLEDDIPLAFLGHIWMLISKGFLHLKAKKDSNEFDVISLDLENPHIRESKKSKIKQKNEFVIDEIDYEELLSQVKPETLDQIEKDIARTNWPYDAYLRNSKINKEKIVNLNKEELQKLKEIDLILRKQCKNVLSAFSVAVKETGYIQGMHSICAAVVYNCFVSKWALGKTKYKDQIELEMRFDEEDIFYIFYGIMKYLKLTEAYMYGFKLMMQKIEEFGQILKTRNPEVHRTLTKNGMPLMPYFASFYLTLFLHMTPVQISRKIISPFLLIGYDLIEHILLGLFSSYKKEISQFEDISELMQFVKRDMFTQSLQNDSIDNLLLFDTLNEYYDNNNN